ncbi:MAG: NTP transferase domain-containing protein, partial [Deltaproteobacteria bacterium]|nr:NTP transferase domain-containing protein [Deltaproteobacteria bacterium]
MITGIILASGFSRRMEDEKLLLKVDDVPMVERVIKAAHASLIDEIILIYRRDAINALANQYGIKAVLNPHAEKGQSAVMRWSGWPLCVPMCQTVVNRWCVTTDTIVM